ncbi:MAG: hypothetical protein LBM28_02975 [Oscillospiraceae bacterium]|nr:hypothetical protein [Oscillospiraceae bacterium]
MRKTILLISICLGILLLFTACAKEAPTPAPEASINPAEVAALDAALPSNAPAIDNPLSPDIQTYYINFLDAIDLSPIIFVGEYMGYEMTDMGVFDCSFKVKEVWRGDFTEEVIHYVSYELGGGTYLEGQDYVLIMQRHESLFYEYPHHTIIGDMFIPVENFSNSLMHGQPLSNHSDEVFEDISSLREWVLNAEPPEEKAKNFTWATDFPTVVKEAELILEVTITGISIEGTHKASNVYLGEVLAFVKGDTYVPFDPETSNEIGITLNKGLEIGETYLVLVNRVDATACFYIQSSPVSVIPLSETETIEEIYALVASN